MSRVLATLKIVVSNGRYDMYGSPTFWNSVAAKLRMNKGGISNTVPDGTYIYTLSVRGLKFIEDLQPSQ